MITHTLFKKKIRTIKIEKLGIDKVKLHRKIRNFDHYFSLSGSLVK
jgi:hypothetical protein